MRITRQHTPYSNYQHHGMSWTPEYRVWVGMKDRCYNPRAKSYVRYGARGITLCQRWKYSFANFIADVGLRPGKGWDIARLNANKGYSPSNCEWQKHSINMKNLRPRQCA